jgi:segregation and condensation protein A
MSETAAAPAPDPTGDAAAAPEPMDALLLHLDGFDGPMDLLLELARAQKVDLARISILSLVEQYLVVIDGARRVRLELAADWLVMAAWLTWLKSRLLLPTGTGAADEGEAAAEVLAARLRALQTIRAAAVWMGARPQLGQDVFARGLPEDLTETDRSRLLLDTPALLRAYLAALRRGTRHTQYRPAAVTLWSVKDALARLESMVGRLPDWATLEQFLPPLPATPEQRRGAVASTLIAGLEMARGGSLKLRQDEAFGPILLRSTQPDSPGADEEDNV